MLSLVGPNVHGGGEGAEDEDKKHKIKCTCVYFPERAPVSRHKSGEEDRREIKSEREGKRQDRSRIRLGRDGGGGGTNERGEGKGKLEWIEHGIPSPFEAQKARNTCTNHPRVFCALAKAAPPILNHRGRGERGGSVMRA